MEELELLTQIENLKFELRQFDRERNETLKLEELRNQHRKLGSPDSQTILYLIRRIFNTEQEVSRLRNLVKKFETADQDRKRAKFSPVGKEEALMQ